VHRRQLGQRRVGGGVVGQLAPAAVVVDDDRAQPRALDDGRLVAVEGDADPQRPRAMQELARERDGERELLACGGRVRFGRQAVGIVLS
jgi:hypothetical protein